MNIALDIGHSKGTGARGNGLEEHDVACVIARHLFAQLKDMGHTVHVLDFPDKGNTEDLNATIKVANADGYDFGISLHCDCAHDRQNACGAHVCFYPGSVQGSRLYRRTSGRPSAGTSQYDSSPAGAGRPQADAHAMGIVRMRVYQ